MRKVLLLASASMLSACASIVSDNDSTTYFQTDPVEKARCELHGQDFTRVINTPDSINLPSDAAPITVACSAPGYRTTTKELDTELDGWIFGNLIFGGIVGGVVDIARGAGQKYPPQITVILDPESFESASGRDAHYAKRSKEVTDKWNHIISEINSQCSSTANKNRTVNPGDCAGKAGDAEKRKQEELSDIESRRSSSKIK